MEKQFQAVFKQLPQKLMSAGVNNLGTYQFAIDKGCKADHL
jgi:hypothetical protein